MNRKSFALAALAFALAASPAFADNKTKDEKIRKLATLGGITSRLDEAVGQILNQGRQTEAEMMSQVNANLDVPPSFRPKFDEANRKFMNALAPTWTTFEIIDVFVKAYSPLVSEEDVDAALAYLTSGAGNRNAAAQTEAATQVAALVATRSGNRVPQAAQAYVAEMRSLVQQCSCVKKTTAPAK